MIKDLKNTFRQTVIYGISNLLVKATGLLLMPIYTATLTLSDYGILTYFEIITQFCVGVFSLSIPASMLRLGSDYNDYSGQRKVYFTASVMLAVLLGIFLVLVIPFRSGLSSVIFNSPDYSRHLLVAFVSVLFEILGLMPLQLLRLREKPVQYILLFSLKLLTMLGAVWYFVSFREMGVFGALLGIMIANGALFVVTVPLQLRNLNFQFDKLIAKELYKFGSPLIFTTIAGLLLTFADRIIIELYGNFSDVGVYSLAYKLGSLSNLLIIGSFALGFLPVAYKKFGDANFDRFFSKMFTYFIGITVLLTLVVSLFSKEAIKLISSDNPDFWLAVVLVPFIAYAFIFKAIQAYLNYIFLLVKKTRYQAVLTITAVSVNISLNFLLIPKYGMYGAIAATAITYVLLIGVTQFFAQKVYPISLEWPRILVLLTATIVLIALGIYVNELPILGRLMAKVALLLVFALFLFFGFADEVERQKIRKAWITLKREGIKSLIRQL